MKSRFVLLAAALALSALASADSYYLRVAGTKQKAFTGGVMPKGHEGTLRALTFDHSIISPRDPQSGLPTGKRMHKPFVITKTLDASTPMFFNSLVNNETLSTVEFEIWQAGGAATMGAMGGIEKKVATIKLTNASIANIETKEMDGATPTAAGKTVMQISFTYQKIEWTWVDGGVTAMDDWEARV